MPGHTTAAEALARLRSSAPSHKVVTYIYIVTEPEGVLVGVVDLRRLVLAGEATTLNDLMVAPPVVADSEMVKEDVVDLFAKYHFQRLPVIDAMDHVIGVIDYKDIMR